jgi:hypothetical protein
MKPRPRIAGVLASVVSVAAAVFAVWLLVDG